MSSDETYYITIKSRDYSNWFVENVDGETSTKHEWKDLINPIQDKMFSRDIFTFKNNQIKIIESDVRNKKEIPGVLVLENNKTFGRTSNKKRLFYKCIPNDKQLPVFLIPYEVKLGFLKVNTNKFVTFKFDNWNEKHPQGLLVQTLGNIDSLPVYYEYQLYCKELHISISPFINKAREELEKKELNDLIQRIYGNSNYIIEDRRETHSIISIDPDGCNDFDDAFSIRTIDDQITEISIYIANVFFWLESFELWSFLSERVSTIYLPDKRRPMLPTILSENLCSLQMGKDRFAFTLCLHVDKQGSILPESIKIINTLIRVKTNYVYEDSYMLSKDTDYRLLAEITKKMDNTVKDSHDVVSFWMIYMNSYCGDLLYKNKSGIFRESVMLKKNNREISHLSNDTKSFLSMWNNVSGSYSLYNEEKMTQHQVMGIEKYIHVTSPIRRLVDIINQTLLMKQNGLIQEQAMSGNYVMFMEKWIQNIQRINKDMKSIRRVQSDCELVYRCFTNPEIVQKEFKGVVFEKFSTEDNFYGYMVYLEEIKLLSRITCDEDMENYSVHSFKIYLFDDEDRIQKKIRLQRIPNNVSVELKT